MAGYLTHTSAGDSQTFTGKPGSVSCGVTAPFSWVLVWTSFCCALQESVSLGGSESFYVIPRLGNLLWALELLQQCENFFDMIVLQFVGCLLGGSIVVLKAISSKKTKHTLRLPGLQQPDPCPRGRSLMTRASTGDTQTLKGRSVSVSCGRFTAFFPRSWRTQALFAPSEVSGGSEMLNTIAHLLPSCWGFSFALGCGVSFWWDPTFSCWWLFSS